MSTTRSSLRTSLWFISWEEKIKLWIRIPLFGVPLTCIYTSIQYVHTIVDSGHVYQWNVQVRFQLYGTSCFVLWICRQRLDDEYTLRSYTSDLLTLLYFHSTLQAQNVFCLQSAIMKNKNTFREYVAVTMTIRFVLGHISYPTTILRGFFPNGLLFAE